MDIQPVYVWRSDPPRPKSDSELLWFGIMTILMIVTLPFAVIFGFFNWYYVIGLFFVGTIIFLYLELEG